MFLLIHQRTSQAQERRHLVAQVVTFPEIARGQFEEHGIRVRQKIGRRAGSLVVLFE